MNLPNKLTVVRLILIPVFAVFFLVKAIPYNYAISAFIFTFAAFTDFLDGYLARKLDLVTDLGKFLDPIADKVLVSTALILLLTAYQPYPLIIAETVFVAIIIARELMISAFRQIAAAKNFIMAADKAGKIKTFTQDAAILVLLIAPEFTGDAFLCVYYVGFALLALSTLLAIYSAANYLIKNRGVLKG